MRSRVIASGALVLALAACGGGGGGAEGANGTTLTNDVASSEAADGGDAQNRMAQLPEGQRNGVLIRAVRDAGLACQNVRSSAPGQSADGKPVWMATCEDGAVYAVAVSANGQAAVQPVAPAQGR